MVTFEMFSIKLSLEFVVDVNILTDVGLVKLLWFENFWSENTYPACLLKTGIGESVFLVVFVHVSPDLATKTSMGNQTIINFMSPNNEKKTQKRWQ